MSEAEKALKRAEKQDPQNTFVFGCRQYFAKNGFLSAKQIAALKNVKPNRYPPRRFRATTFRDDVDPCGVYASDEAECSHVDALFFDIPNC